MLQQKIEIRKSRMVNTAEMGFEDYEREYDMSFSQFANHVLKKYTNEGIDIISISYPNDDTAVVQYKVVQKTIEEWERIFDTTVTYLEGFPPETDKSHTRFTKNEFLKNCKKSTVKMSDCLLKEWTKNA